MSRIVTFFFFVKNGLKHNDPTAQQPSKPLGYG